MVPTFTELIQHGTRSCSQRRQEKEIEGNQIRKEKVKLSLQMTYLIYRSP